MAPPFLDYGVDENRTEGQDETSGEAVHGGSVKE
jgi:hypothetical protein